MVAATLAAAAVDLPNWVETISFVKASEGCSSEEMERALKDRQTSAPRYIQLCLGRG